MNPVYKDDNDLYLTWVKPINLKAINEYKLDLSHWNCGLEN